MSMKTFARILFGLIVSLGLINCGTQKGFDAISIKTKAENKNGKTQPKTQEIYDKEAKERLVEYRLIDIPNDPEVKAEKEAEERSKIEGLNAAQIAEIITGIDAIVLENSEANQSKDRRFSVEVLAAIKIGDQLRNLRATGFIGEYEADRSDVVNLVLSNSSAVEVADFKVAAQCENTCNELVVFIEGPASLSTGQTADLGPIASYTFIPSGEISRGLMKIAGSSVNDTVTRAQSVAASLKKNNLLKNEMKDLLASFKGESHAQFILGTSLATKALAVKDGQSLDKFLAVEVSTLVRNPVNQEEVLKLMGVGYLKWVDVILGQQVNIELADENGQNAGLGFVRASCFDSCSEVLVYQGLGQVDAQGTPQYAAVYSFQIDANNTVGQRLIRNKLTDTSLGEAYKSYEEALEIHLGVVAEKAEEAKEEVKSEETKEEVKADEAKEETPTEEKSTEKAPVIVEGEANGEKNQDRLGDGSAQDNVTVIEDQQTSVVKKTLEAAAVEAPKDAGLTVLPDENATKHKSAAAVDGEIARRQQQLEMQREKDAQSATQVEPTKHKSAAAVDGEIERRLKEESSK